VHQHAACLRLSFARPSLRTCQSSVVVNPAHRGNGIGRMLLDATLAALKARGAPRVVLSTAERNAGAQRLFARAGFRRTMIEMTHELDDVAC
jgi:ribosomal protein S18 acetylase RimI-like enzyme